MTQSNIDTVNGIYEAFARRDLEEIMSVLDPEVITRQEGPLPWAGTYHGHAGVAEFLGKLLAQIEPHLDIEELVSSGDHVVQIGRTHGNVLANGKKFDAREIHIWQFHDGLAISYQVHIDVPHMLNALA